MRVLFAAALLLGPATLGAAPLISEVMFHPPHRSEGENLLEEWIEIHNPGPAPANLDGWSLGGVEFTFSNVTLGVGAYLVVAADPATFQVLHPTVPDVVGGWRGQLSNRSDVLLLHDAQGRTVDRVEYADGGDWATRRPGPDDQGHSGWTWDSPADGGGKSLELQNPALPNNSGQNWLPSAPSGGTPGQQNSVFSSNIAPLIEEVSHHPPVPGPNDLVLVRARLTDDFLGAHAVLHYRVSSPTPGAFQPVTMNDEGRRGDERAGDGIHTALLPVQPDRTVVEFYLQAFDAIQNRTWPGPTDPSGTQGANLLYQVDSEAHRGREAFYRLILPVPEHDEFFDIPYQGPELATNARFNATFIAQVGDAVTTIYQCGLRLRGDELRDRYPRNMKVLLPSPRTWQGQSELNLNSQFTYNQLLGSLLYREAGLPVYECKAVQVRMNGFNHASETRAVPAYPFEHHYGLYAQVEPFNASFVDRHFPLDRHGNLYRMNGGGTAWQYFPDSPDLAADYSGTGWRKETNAAANNWDDLHQFLGVMSTAGGGDYLEQIEAVLDLDSWLRSLAVSTILTTAKPSIFTGRNDAYALYRGTDGRFKLLPDDFHTVLGQGTANRIEISDLPHTLFDFIESEDSFQQLKPLFQQPEVMRRYLRILGELLEGPFAEDRINPLIEDALSWTPPRQASLAKEFLAARRAGILAEIDPPLTVSTTLPLLGAQHTTTTDSAPLAGRFNPATADLVFVNGTPAVVDHRTGTWSFTANGLFPGINRLTVEERNTDGEIVTSTRLDIYYDDGSSSEVFGTLATNTRLDAASGPWQVSATVVVPDGITLTIERGTTLFFDSGTGITVQRGGTLRCAGAPYERIRLTGGAGNASRWLGIDFSSPGGLVSSSANRIAFTDMEYGDDQGEAIRVTNSRLTLHHVTWEHSEETVLELNSPQILVQDCSFPSIPSGEAIHASNLNTDDGLILRRNRFLRSSGYHDLVCINGGRRPGPIFAAYDNIFAGSTDDCLDLNNCDAHIEGNIFLNVHPDSPRTSTSNAITTDAEANLTVVRNLFYDVDHALLLKNESTAVFENNTVVRATIAAINFDEVQGNNIEPGKRIDMDSNIFLDCAAVLLNELSAPPEPDPVIIGHRNILPSAHFGIGAGNLDLDPFLADKDAGPIPKDNWALSPGSPARGTGRNGTDRGALVPAGARALGLPAPVTNLTSLTLPVEGPGVTHYRWRLVSDGVPDAWSADTPLSSPIDLTGLPEATFHLDVLARDTAGHWQDPAEFNSSPRWTVDFNAPRGVVLNEVLAARSPAADQVELFNGTSALVSLDGWFLSDDPQNPQKRPLAGISIPAGSHLTVPASKIPGLSPRGETLALYDGAVLVDSISWGAQADGFSLGRLPSTGAWSLTLPTLGAPNVRAGTAPPHDLRINEWLATAAVRYSSGYVELFNPNDSPVALGDLWISNSLDQPRAHQLPPNTFIGPEGFFVLQFTGSTASDPDEVPLVLDSFQSSIVLSDPSGNPIDQVRIACLHPDLAEGRQPDGSSVLRTFDLGSPGQSNNRAVLLSATTPVPFQSGGWQFLDNDDPPAEWIEPDYDDSAWETGPAPLGRETTALPVLLATDPSTVPAFDYVQGRKNYYFRRTFEFDGDPETTSLTLTTYLDDGAVFYLNGGELYRHNMPAGLLDENTWARNTIDNAEIEGPFEIPRGRLVRGTNTLAVVTYQIRASSSDIVFDCELNLTGTIPAPPTAEEARMRDLLDYLRITEVMYNPPDGDDGEFIELQNISDSLTLDLDGVRFTEGVEFTYPDIQLGPGERVVVVKDLGLFRFIHGPSPQVAGEFESKLNDESEAIALTLPAPRDVHIQRFIYLDDWFDETDGFGRSLELTDPGRPLGAWNDAPSWIDSYAIHGSPGAPNSASSFPAWTAVLGTGLGDTDGDGLADVMEYGFGFDALTPEFQAILLDLQMNPERELATTFLIPALAPPDVTFLLQSSNDMKNWTTRATRVGNGPWTGSNPVESARPPSGLGLAILRLPFASPVLLTRLRVVVEP